MTDERPEGLPYCGPGSTSIMLASNMDRCWADDKLVTWHNRTGRCQASADTDIGLCAKHLAELVG